MASFRFTKLKITAGYTLLLAILLFSLVFVHREMEALSAADDQQNLRTDSLLTLLHEKDQNTIQMLRVLSEANDSLLSASEIEEIISEQDSVITQQRVQHRVITKRDSLITTPKKKGFFKRLAEVFSPSKQDSAVLVNTSLEVATDTILQPTTSKDSLQQKIRMATEEKRLQRKKTIRRTSTKYQRMNTQLTARMDSLIKQYEEEMTLRARQDAELQQEVRMRSARIIGGIAVGAVLLSAFFLILIMRDISRSNRYRQQLEVANKRAEDLLVAREKLMLAITHDFKAPLGSIMGYTELLSRLTEDERQRFYLDNMKSSSEHLLKLVSDLLDFHRLDLNKAEVNRVTFNPSQLFDEIYVSFEPLTAAKGLALQCHVAPELNGRYISDPLRLRQIVNNLLSNAVKFTQTEEAKVISSVKLFLMVLMFAFLLNALIIIFRFIKDIKTKSYSVFAIFALAMSVGMFMILTLHGYRTFYLSLIIFVSLTIYLASYIVNEYGIRLEGKVLRVLNVTAVSALLCFAVLLPLQTIQNYDVFAMRQEYVDEKISQGEKLVYVPKVPNKNLVRDEFLHFYKDYFTAEHQDVDIVFIDIEDWERFEEYQSMMDNPLTSITYAVSHLQFSN